MLRFEVIFLFVELKLAASLSVVTDIFFKDFELDLDDKFIHGKNLCVISKMKEGIGLWKLNG
jgi:hypothetical protein